jgi:hypothetical protein
MRLPICFLVYWISSRRWARSLDEDNGGDHSEHQRQQRDQLQEIAP